MIFLLFSYICGCINGAYYIGKFIYKQDIRTVGSQNAGARNAGRVFGRTALVSTVVIDALKTILPICLSIYFFGDSFWFIWLVTILIMAGHIWPVQLKGHGGKGVVVYLAVLLVLEPVILLFISVVVGLGKIIGIRFTYIGLASLCIVPIILIFFSKFELALLFITLLFIVLLAHRKEPS
ncbi:glycerol-3-phosphate acyltransferase [Bacillus sp. JCM 19041]|uniref:glycerol-3-phosphate acyltransferase n=1 Tax=Bacillus sp. JCM 19041 TaxID=1460637 RepID=UPI0006CF700C